MMAESMVLAGGRDSGQVMSTDNVGDIATWTLLALPRLELGPPSVPVAEPTLLVCEHAEPPRV